MTLPPELLKLVPADATVEQLIEDAAELLKNHLRLVGPETGSVYAKVCWDNAVMLAALRWCEAQIKHKCLSDEAETSALYRDLLEDEDRATHDRLCEQRDEAMREEQEAEASYLALRAPGVPR